MNPLKPWSNVQAEPWFQKLQKQEQQNVAAQHLKLAEQNKAFQARFLETKGRSPTEEEFAPLASKIPPYLSIQEEKGLEEPPISPYDLIGAGAVKGLGQIGKQMATDVALTPMQKFAKAKGQGGWIGSEASNNSPEVAARLSLAKEYTNKGMDKETVWEETGVFDYGMGLRYFDYDVVDDYVKNKGNLLKEGSGYVSLKGQVGDKFPSLIKHVPEKNQQGTFIYKDPNLSSAGLFDPSPPPRIFYKSDPDKVVPHEIQHLIQYVQKSSSRGYNTADALSIVKNSPKLLEKLDKKNQELVKKGAFMGKGDVAYDVYRHNLGEVEASVTQVYHSLIKKEVLRGSSAKEIKELLDKVNPYNIVKRRYNLKKMWREKDLKPSASEQEKTLQDQVEELVEKLRKEDPKLKVKLTKEDLSKIPAVLKKQAY